MGVIEVVDGMVFCGGHHDDVQFQKKSPSRLHCWDGGCSDVAQQRAAVNPKAMART